MNSIVEDTKDLSRPPDPERFASYERGMECLGRSISMLRAWAVQPQMFDHLSLADRQNLFLIALEFAESAQTQLSRPN